ncbi:HNH endonuclease [Coprobacter secundus]|uniref:HNH endonuclease n=1 Tax=Coprobacter secundus TaxID=1501392 RepID=UPI0023F9A52B|nr:HNH endonuclease [Coprobacter secundus]
MKQLDYKFYPSLLDKFEQYLRVDEKVESPFNLDENGEYKRSYDEIEAEEKQSLIDAINRVPFESEAADKGTAFNDIIDCLIHNNKPEGKTQLQSNRDTNTIEARIKDRVFLFDLNWCIEQAKIFTGSASQVYVESDIETKYGIVQLYGYVDEILKSRVIDLKTTSRYEFGKYENGWQKHVYPYCLEKSGWMTVTDFEYAAFQLKGGTRLTPLISGTYYPEIYRYNHKQTTQKLKQHCERFIEFIEENRKFITDEKIFALI